MTLSKRQRETVTDAVADYYAARKPVQQRLDAAFIEMRSLRKDVSRLWLTTLGLVASTMALATLELLRGLGQ